MRLTILGKSPSWQDAGGACSGYLLQQGETTVLLDCGSGVFSKLRQAVDYGSVDAVVISHMHADHFFDLVPFSYALLHSSGGPRRSRPRLILPPGAPERLRALAGTWNQSDLIESAFEIEGYEAGSAPVVGGLSFDFQTVPHFIETFAVRVRGAGGTVVYGADSRPSPDLAEFSVGADVLLLEGTLPDADPGGSQGHMTPREAGDHARRAGAGRLVLTHISDEVDLEAARDAAADAFGGPTDLAREFAVYEV